MEKYFLLCAEERSDVAIAYTIGEPPISYELISSLEGKSKLPFNLILKKVHQRKNGPIVTNELSEVKFLWRDYQPNCLAWPMFSEKMKKIIEKNLMGYENIDWIEAEIEAYSEQKKYYILRFNSKLDLLDLKKTSFIPGTELILKGYFTFEKIKKINVFYLPKPNDYWKITSGIYISQKLKEALEEEKLEGLIFEDISSDRIT